MSGNRFDRLTKALGEAPTRRSALKVLAGAAVGALAARAFPDVCDTTHICNVQRDATTAGGTVQVIFAGFI